MSRSRMRSNWVAGVGDPAIAGGRRSAHRGGRRPVRPRRWLLVTGAGAALATAVSVTGALLGVGASPALAVCDSAGGACIDTTAATTASIAIIPLQRQGDDRLAVRNDGAQGDTEVGVVGYVTSDAASATSVTPASPGTAASVELDQHQRKQVRLSGVPSTARAVIVQVGSSFARSQWAKSHAACTSPVVPSASASSGSATATDASTSAVQDGARRCGTALVAFSGRHDTVDRTEIATALRDFASRTATAMPTPSAVADFAASVDRATIAAAIAPGPGSLTVSWKLAVGSDKVSAVRVASSGPGSGAAPVDRPASDGSYTLSGLRAGARYTVTVAPVVGGATVSPISMTATTLANTAGGTPSSAPSSSAPSVSSSPSASPSATPSNAAPTPSSGSAMPAANAYPGWTRVIAQNFDTDAALGSFASKYPGWAGYDGSTSGASGTTWNSSTTMSVSGSVLRMRNWMSNGKAQAGALTPIVPGTGSWNQQGQTYGKYVVRFKADSVKGFKVAWLLWPTSNNWSSGEVDFPEANLDGAVGWAAHNVLGNPSDQTWGATATRMADGKWHTATTTWEPGRITYELDGSVVKTVTDPTYLPTQPMRWDLQNETSTDGTSPAANADGSVYIDWVAQYKRG
ncbi:family 16 glycosylhydrolase [Amnibacterium sp.]|uniref:family 16 glycosylhydrolase n=1 Tax=Amnibacterium sp. TaxID=1872496 RepID=UPI003F7BDC26